MEGRRLTLDTALNLELDVTVSDLLRLVLLHDADGSIRGSEEDSEEDREESESLDEVHRSFFPLRKMGLVDLVNWDDMRSQRIGWKRTVLSWEGTLDWTTRGESELSIGMMGRKLEEEGREEKKK